MAIEEDEAAFINIIGSLKPDELEKVMDRFDVQINGDDADAEENN
jgi:hypothetical protein